METYYVTQEQLDLIDVLKNLPCPLVAIMQKQYVMEKLYDELPLSDREWLRYLGGDETIEFKVKEPSYCLYHIAFGLKIFFIDWQTRTEDKKMAFTASLEKIKLYQTPEWEIEEAK